MTLTLLDTLQPFALEQMETTVTVSRDDLPPACAAAQQAGAILVSMIATDEVSEIHLHYLFRLVASAAQGAQLLTIRTVLPADDLHYPSVTPLIAAAHWYEREARDLFGAVPIGHPDPRRLVLHDDWPRGYHPMRKAISATERPPRAEPRPYPFRPVKGHGVSEVPVGPIHAGIIEPGHFRFSVIGERIIQLDARLFYVHRGIEKLCEGQPIERVLEIVERICGVCSYSHALAFCQAVEALSAQPLPERAVVLRSLFLELERLYNHVGDLGNICAGVGLAIGTMAGARLKDQLQTLAAQVTGSRFLRGVLQPGGLRLTISDASLSMLQRGIGDATTAVEELIALLFATPSFMERLRGTGILPYAAARDLGAVGVAARASGWPRDSRLDHPFAAYVDHPPTLCIEESGDVEARVKVRAREARASVTLMHSLLEQLPAGAVWQSTGELRRGAAGVGWAESPRGEHLHWLRLTSDGLIDRLRVRAASYSNWPVVPLAVPGNMIPDFPLINKSFELCYSCLDR